MKKGLILVFIIIIIVIVLGIFFISYNKEKVILTDPIGFTLTEDDVGGSYYLNVEDNSTFRTGTMEFPEDVGEKEGVSKGYIQLFSDSDYYVNLSETLIDSDVAQKFLVYNLRITILSFDSVKQADDYYLYFTGLPFYSDMSNENFGLEKVSSCNVGDKCITGRTLVEDTFCYYEDCTQYTYWTVFRNNNILVMINQNVPDPFDENYVINLAEKIDSKIK